MIVGFLGGIWFGGWYGYRDGGRGGGFGVLWWCWERTLVTRERMVDGLLGVNGFAPEVDAPVDEHTRFAVDVVVFDDDCPKPTPVFTPVMISAESNILSHAI